MNSGRISPIIRQFFTPNVSAKTAPDSNSQNRQDQREPDREPTKEEALEALDLLTQQEEFQKNSLRAELREAEGKFSIIVMNSSGAQLRVIRGMDILRVLMDGNAVGRKGHHLGRILDRRV